MSQFDREFLSDMLDYATTATRVLGPADVTSVAADDTKFLALSYAVQVVGEAASKVSAEGRAALPEIPWPDVIGMRHRLVHGYRTRSAEVIVRTVKTNLPPLIVALRRALENDIA